MIVELVGPPGAGKTTLAEALDRLDPPFGVPFLSFEEYRALDLAAWFGAARPAVLDANKVLSADQRAALAALGCRSASIGRGEGA